VTSAAIAKEQMSDESSQTVLRSIIIGVVRARNFFASFVLRA